MSTYDKIISQADTLIQQRGFQGFSYADLEKVIGIRKASIHHHFPTKTDLGLAYCEYKSELFNRFNSSLRDITPGSQRLKKYLDAFANCADKGEMCGVYAMLSDSHQFSSELQNAVSLLAQTELRILEDILASGQENGEVVSIAPPSELAVIVCSALKGALMLNRIFPNDVYSGTITTLMTMLCPGVKNVYNYSKFNS